MKSMLLLSMILLVVSSPFSFAKKTPINELNRQTLVFTQTHLGEKYACAHETLTTVYNQLDYSVVFRTMPNKRALKEANDGNADGEMLRADGVELNYPNLIQVPVPLCSITSVLLAKKHVYAKSFKEVGDYRIGITAGFVDQENLAKENNWEVSRTGKHNLLIEMFFRDRVDVIFITQVEALQIIKDNPEREFKVLGNLKRDLYLYHYLHKKHSNLIPTVTDTLETLKKKGKIDLKARKNISYF